MSALAEVLRFPVPEIKSFKPSEIDMKRAVALGLDELIPRGYLFEGQAPSSGVRAMSEYEHDDARTDIHLVIINDKAAASMVVSKWTPDDLYGKKCWVDLKSKNASLYRRLYKRSPTGIYIEGITTHPDFRSQGLADKLYDYVVGKEKPSFFAGLTKTPEAVLARAKCLAKRGYRTFYGNIEITPGKEKEFTNDHQNILDAVVHAKYDSLWDYDDGSDVFYIDSYLPITIPDLDRLSPIMKKAFEDVAKAQALELEKGKKRVAVKISLSVRDNIRLQAPPDIEENDPLEGQLPLGLFGENQQT